MANLNAVGVWAKHYHLAARALMERVLRPHELGSTQWYVLYQLAHHGPTPQRAFLTLLKIEKPTLSEIVGALVRKGFVRQSADPQDQRQRLLSLTDEGKALWDRLPDPIAIITDTAFRGVDPQTLELVADTLRAATERLNSHAVEGLSK